MSKNITIQEGGTGKSMTVDKLKTALNSGGTCLWVPEDEVQLTTKHITEDGTYKASDDGYYGYSEVTVSGIGVATGKDSNGDAAVVYTDPETGNLVEEKLPESIEVVTPPTNPYGIYANGQTITKDGMVVKAYTAGGVEYCIVPNEEVTISPTTAAYDPTGEGEIDTPDYQNSGSVLVTGGATLQSIINHIVAHVRLGDPSGQFPGSTYSRENPTYVGDTSLLDHIGHMANYANDVETTYFSGTVTGLYAFDDSIEGTTISIPGSHQLVAEVSVNFRTDRTQNQSGGYDYVLKPTVTITPSSSNGNITYIGQQSRPASAGTEYQISGINATAAPAGSSQTINVSWPRPYDNEVLETSFTIRVAPSPSGNDDQT